MSVTTLFNIPLTASHTIQSKDAPRDADSPPFRSSTTTPARASRDHAPARAASPSTARATSPARLTHAHNPHALLRHAPLRPPRGHIVDAPAYMRAARVPDAGQENTLLQASHDDARSCTSHASLSRHGNLRSIASNDSGIGSGNLAGDARSIGGDSAISCSSTIGDATSIGRDSVTSDPWDSGRDSPIISGYGGGDADSRRPSFSGSRGSMADAGLTGHGEDGQTAEAAITITDDAPHVAMSEHALFLHGGARAPSSAVRAAVDALLTECQRQPAARPAAGPRMTAPAADAADITEAAQLYRLGGQVHRALFDRAPGWLARAAAEVADAAVRLTQGATRQNIELAFVRLGLRHAIDKREIRNGPPSVGGRGPHAASTTDLSASPDAVGRLRAAGDAHRRVLDAALDRALPPRIVPQTRLIAERIIDVVAEMANDVQAAPRTAGRSATGS